MSATQEVGEIFGAGAGPAHAMLRSPTVLIASIGLWGMNVYFFKLFGIDYSKVLHHDLRKLNQKEASNSSSESSVMDDEELSIMDSTADHRQHDDISAAQLACLSITLLLLLHTTYLVWIDWLGGGTIGAIFAFYGAVCTAIMFPLQSTNWLRHSSLLVIYRFLELLKPRFQVCSEKLPRPIPFIDVFFADAMCSLSKVFFDWGMLLHMGLYYPQPVPANLYNILIPSVCAAMPYLIRTRQCLVMYKYCNLKNDSGQNQHLWNALKYTTSIVPLILSAYQRTVPKARSQELDIFLILLLIINASYALWWDVVKDWGMMTTPGAVTSVLCNPTSTSSSFRDFSPTQVTRNPSGTTAAVFGSAVVSAGGHTNNHHHNCWYALLRNRLRFGVTISVVILVTDAVLRFSWLLRFFDKLFPSNDSFVLCTQFLEVFRRAIWNLLRVEWENLKQSGHHTLAASNNNNNKPNSSPQVMIPMVNPDETQFLVQRTKDNNNKITSEKNAEA